MTYGESLFVQRELCQMKDGEIVIKGLPKRMEKTECLSYYNKKLWSYWNKVYRTGKKEVK